MHPNTVFQFFFRRKNTLYNETPMKGTEMTSDFDLALEFHIKRLVKEFDDNLPIRKKLYDSPSNISLDDVLVLRERLQTMEANVTLLNNAYEVHLEDEKKKAKRRRFPFKK